jgi:hypothetical protein
MGTSPNTPVQTPGTPEIHTQALRRALLSVRDALSAQDLLFLETWEMSAIPGAAAALRASQLRRANPELAAEIRAEVTSKKRQIT